ncbi:MAG TPA: phosphoribosylformylglycinamidine cyclo-ligase [Nitrososphaeraceae archaeon]
MISKKGATYRSAGIDLKTIQKYHRAIEKLISSTHRLSSSAKVISGFGHYAGLIEIDNKVLALHSDGVGSKVLVAQLMHRFDTIGIDCIAMNANDIICLGAEPVTFINYIALGSSNNNIVTEIVKGLVKGSELARVSIVGGETAVLPDIITGSDPDNAFDLSGTILGLVNGKERLVLGNKIEVGDIILGINSSGLHSNGYSLARRILLGKYSLHDRPKYLSNSIGEEMLIPTMIYVGPVVNLLKRSSTAPVHGLAHITGGAFTKLLRLNNKVRYNLKALPPPDGVFKQIEIDGPVGLKEMYKTFNMGIGFCVIAPKESIDAVIKLFNQYQMQCCEIGIVDEKGKGQVVATLNGKQETLA